MEARQMEEILKVIQEIKRDPARKADQMAAGLRLSRATFYRRLEDAGKLLGFSVRYDRGSRTYRIIEGHFGPILQLSPLEVFSLIMAARHLSVAGDHTLAFDAITTMRRIAGTGPKSLRYFLDFLLSDVVLQRTYCCSSEVIDPLREAVEKRGQVRLEYREQMSGEVKTFTVEPYHLLFKWRALYLDGYCVDTGDFRMFRISRIQNVKIFPLKRIKRRAGYDFASRHGNSFRVFVSDKAPVEVKVKFRPGVAPMIMESFWHPSERKEELPDGSIILSVVVSHPPEVVWWALQWGAEAEVLAPASARALAVKTIDAMREVYER